MSALIRVNGGSGRPDAKREYREFWADMYPVVVVVVEASLMNAVTLVRDPTSAIVKERVEMAKKIVDEMRQDFHWSKTRIRDNLAIVLRSRLAGLAVDMDTLGKRSSW